MSAPVFVATDAVSGEFGADSRLSRAAYLQLWLASRLKFRNAQRGLDLRPLTSLPRRR